MLRQKLFCQSSVAKDEIPFLGVEVQNASSLMIGCWGFSFGVSGGGVVGRSCAGFGGVGDCSSCAGTWEVCVGGTSGSCSVSTGAGS